MTRKRLLVPIALASMATLGQSQDAGGDALEYIKNNVVYVNPKFTIPIARNVIEEEAAKLEPFKVRVVAVPSMPNKYRSGKTELRGRFASDLAGQLKMGDKLVLIVLTNSGISGYSPLITPKNLTAISDQAVQDHKDNKRFDLPGKGLDILTIKLAETVAKQAKVKLEASQNNGVAPVRTNSPLDATSQAEPQKQGSALPWILLAAGGIGGGIWWASRRAAINQAKQRALKDKRAAFEMLDYLDSYDGLLEGAEANEVLQYRTRMGEVYDEALVQFERAKTKDDFLRAGMNFSRIKSDFDSAHAIVQRSTQGTGIAYKIPPAIDEERAPVFEPVKGVSYFSSEPSDSLVPVEVNFGGQRRTVMVTPDERDELMSGRLPQMRGMNGPQGQFVPWYQVQGYNPMTMYGSNDFLWTFLAMNAFSNAFTPHYGYGWGGGLFGGHGGYGYGGGTVINNYYGDSQNQSIGTGGGDFGGAFGDSGSGGGDFGSKNDGGSSFDFGNFFGGGDGGGGFGGGSDSGGGGDFGGGDSGGGGGDW